METQSVSRINQLYQRVFTTSARYIDIWGGRGRGGSHFATDYYLILLQQPQYFRGVFMREVLSDVRTSLFQDFLDRLAESGIPEGTFRIDEHNMKVVNPRNGNMIISKGFKKSSRKQTAKLKSLAGATHVIIEECEEIDEDDHSQLDDSFRTVKGDIKIIRLFNPPKKNHWLIRNHYHLIEESIVDPVTGESISGYYRAVPKPNPQLLSIFSTYHANAKNLNPSWIINMESYRQRSPEWYYTTVCGLVSEGAKGRIYSGWQPITGAEWDALPYPTFYGLDFGYSEDPLALDALKLHNGKLFVKPLIYQSGLSDDELGVRMDALGVRGRVFADSSEPKSIDKLNSLGFHVEGVGKGPDSINYGIKQVKGLTVYYVSDLSLDYEYQEYRWHLDAAKLPTDTPEDKHNHHMDAIRYAVMGLTGRVVKKPAARRPMGPKSAFS